MAAVTVTPVTVAAKAVLPKIIRAGLSPCPTLQVWVNFSGTEVDIAPDVQRLSISRGRSRERETMSPGRADINLWNAAGKYDPDNYSSPYYPNIRPNKPVRIVAVTDTGTVPLFDGRLEGSTLNYAEGGLQPTVTWRAVDASKRLNRDRSTTGFGTAGELSGARVAAVLSGATPAWPTSERTIAPGTKTVQYAAGEQGRYDYLVQVAASEPGAFFIGADGKAVFRDANWEPTTASPALGSASDEYRFSSIEITDDESEIFNAVTVTANAIADQVEEDFSSQAEFGRSDLSVSSLLDTGADMDDLSLTYLVAYSSPRRRISRLRADRTVTDWYWFLSKELMDRVTVRHRPVYGGTFAQNSAIQGIQVEVNGSQDWEITWNLSPPLDIITNPNLLTANQASMETSSAGWLDLSGVISIVGTASGTVPFVGSKCLELSISLSGGRICTTPYTTVPVTVGHTYRAGVWMRSYFASAYGEVIIDWLNSGGTVIAQSGSSSFGPYYSGTTEWVNGTVEGTAPPGAAYAKLEVFIIDADGPHPAYIDAAELRDTLVIASINPQPARIATVAALPAPTILTTPQSRTVSVATIARSAALPAPTVTGGSSFVPTDISGIQGWYDFSTVTTHLYQDAARTTIITTDGQTIGGVADKSGTGHHLIADTAGTEPTYKTAILNGKSVARFDGTGDYLYHDSFTADATQTIFVVAKKRSAVAASAKTLFSLEDGLADVYTHSATSASGYGYDLNSVSASRSLGGTAVNTNVIALRYNSTTSLDYWINGGAKANFTPNINFSSSAQVNLGTTTGAVNPGDFDVGEVIIYNSALSLTDVNRVGPYLATKWGFTWTTAT